jgi:hypothetical protein
MPVKIELPYIPRWSAVVALSGIVESLAVTAHEKHFVDGVGVHIGVEEVDHFGELLPLGCVGGVHAWVRLVEQAEVEGCLQVLR